MVVVVLDALDARDAVLLPRADGVGTCARVEVFAVYMAERVAERLGIFERGCATLTALGLLVD